MALEMALMVALAVALVNLALRLLVQALAVKAIMAALELPQAPMQEVAVAVLELLE
jgi:hypothetical protein